MRSQNGGFGPVSPLKTQRAAAAGRAVDGEADRRHRVARAEHFHATGAELEDLADAERHEAQHRIFGGGQAREVGPELVVEQVVAQHGQRLGQRVHLDRGGAARLAAAQHAVGQQRHAQHVVQVRVREQDVVDAFQLVEREVADAGAGVDQHILVEQEAGGAAVARDRPGAAEDLDFHAGITRRK